ncbi:hypothetical protein KR009_005639 [Drosophila setifemur]|nr:hypothetical protein KR009_005639 [Drosophila setifemur]
MHKGKDMKRTGVYRVSGNIADFQLELRLRHISEWLPVPRFEYVGARPPAGHGDHYPETEEESWSDCHIHVPLDDDTYGAGNRLGYFPTYHRTNRRRVKAIREKGEEEQDHGEYQLGEYQREKDQEGEYEQQEHHYQQQEHHYQEPQNSAFKETPGDPFYEQNRELCNGAMATLVISWQQKFFSLSEMERYVLDPGTCASKQQRRYHNWALETRELQFQHRWKMENQGNPDSDTDEDLEPVRVRRRTRKAKRRLKNRSPTMSGLSSANLSEVSVEDGSEFVVRTCLIHTLVDGDPEDYLSAEAREFRAAGFQVMYVYAELQRDTLLVSLRYDPVEGLLYVYPDFCASAQDLDYMVQIERDNDCRQLYAYGFGNVTKVEAPGEREQDRNEEEEEGEWEDVQEEEQEEELLGEEAALLADASALQLLDFYQNQRLAASELRSLLHFELPPKRMRRISLLLELHEAQFFEHPNIHVRYYLEPPKHTFWEDALRGTTATCKDAGDFRVARLGHCWQVTLLCEEQHQPEDRMHLYFEVISIDSWQRERSEGFAHFSCSLIAPLPLETIKMQCIRPVDSWWDALNRYFIGGRRLFDFVSYFRSGEDQGELHTRLDRSPRRATRSTGHLVLRLQKLQQRHLEQRSTSQLQLQLELSEASSDSDGYEEEGRSLSKSTAKATTLDEVMAAYVEARERIQSLLTRAIEA